MARNANTQGTSSNCRDSYESGKGQNRGSQNAARNKASNKSANTTSNANAEDKTGSAGSEE